MPAYRLTDESDRFLATVQSGGEPVVVHRTRARRYPGLDSPAPATAAVYRAARHALPARGELLDLGAGAGAGTSVLAGPSHAITGLDPSDEAVAFARAFTPAARFVAGELTSLDAAARFDGVAIVDVLGLLDAPQDLLSAARSRARDGAAFVVAEPRATTEQSLIAPARRAFTREALDALLVRSGLVAAPLVAAPAEFVAVLAHVAPSLETADALSLVERCGPGREVSVEQAMSAVERALEHATDPIDARELLLAYGALHLRQRDLDSAAGTFVGVLRMAAEGCARAQLGLGRVAEAVGRPADAIRLFERATQTDPLDADAWHALGSAHARMGDARSAARALARAVRLAPADARVVEALAGLSGADPGGVAQARATLAAYARGG